ncbi:MAG: hypothetical protein Fur0037_07630 [Planctomycetota bacterium]
MRRGTTERRISVLAGAFVSAFAVLLLQLAWLMLGQNDIWTLRSYLNRWTFRDVPAHRGAILSRSGDRLAYDSPSFELSVDYQSFRRYHPMGAAVHGATMLADYTPSLAGVRYTYSEGPRGPMAAAAALLDLPIAWLSSDGLSSEARKDRRDVRFYCVSLLSACSRRSRSQVYRELRQAEENRPQASVGDALPALSRSDLLRRYERIVAVLAEIDRRLRAGEGHGALIDRLDQIRQEWFASRDQKEHPDPSRLRPLADRLPFELVAGLRSADSDHPGLWMLPAVVRERGDLAERHPLVASLLGGVKVIDRLVPVSAEDDAKARRRKLVEAVRARGDEILDDEGLSRIVPDDLAPENVKLELRRRARRYIEAVVRRGDRRGSSGVERAMDFVLAGDPGIRLVERDKRAREQRLYSRLDVRPGADVTLSIDFDLQDLADRVVRDTHDLWAPRARVPEWFGTGLVVLDATTGEILAISGLPADTPELRSRPLGLNWRRFGALGSIVKPFLLIEQFEAARLGGTHRPLEEFRDCTGPNYGIVAGQRLGCLHADGEAGRIPELALMKSCNAFFFQVAEGIGHEGIDRALARFGLLPGPGLPEGTYAPCPFGMSSGMVSPPEANRAVLRQKRAIGYGISASPLLVARAYAALATGVLRTPSLVRGLDLPSVPLGVPIEELERVREGLRLCVEDPRGTAHDQASLRTFSVRGKTGTAEVSRQGDNNAWFAGYLPYSSPGGEQLAFAGVVYHVPHRSYGGDVAGALVAALLDGIAADPRLQGRYGLRAEAGR